MRMYFKGNAKRKKEKADREKIGRKEIEEKTRKRK